MSVYIPADTLAVGGQAEVDGDVNDGEKWMSRVIEVVPYNPEWPGLFHIESEHIRRVFGDEIVAIHHIGSTAIPGIKAKPVLDFLVVVQHIAQVNGYNQAMISLGYEPLGENGIPGRRYFRKDTNGIRSHHVHIFQVGHPEIDRHIHFREYLCCHPEDMYAYSHLKESLTQQYRLDPPGYNDAKSMFIQEIDRKAAAWWQERCKGD
jgi:GrpB-like predicted nucleotidyltransferase (UPF0157 family)